MDAAHRAATTRLDPRVFNHVWVKATNAVLERTEDAGRAVNRELR